MFLAPCWLGWGTGVWCGPGERRGALHWSRAEAAAGGEEMLSTVASLCYGAEHYFRHTLHTIPATATTSHCCTHFSELCVRSHHRTGAAAETVNKPVNSDPCVRHSCGTDNLTRCVSVVIVLYMTPTVTCSKNLVAPEGVVTYRSRAPVGED